MERCNSFKQMSSEKKYLPNQEDVGFNCKESSHSRSELNNDSFSLDNYQILEESNLKNIRNKFCLKKEEENDIENGVDNDNDNDNNIYYDSEDEETLDLIMKENLPNYKYQSNLTNLVNHSLEKYGKDSIFEKKDYSEKLSENILSDQENKLNEENFGLNSQASQIKIEHEYEHLNNQNYEDSEGQLHRTTNNQNDNSNKNIENIDSYMKSINTDKVYKNSNLISGKESLNLKMKISEAPKIDLAFYSKYLKSSIINIITDREISTTLQSRVYDTETNVFTVIYDEIFSKFVTLMKQPYSNYYCQIVFDHVDSERRRCALRSLLENLDLSFSNQVYYRSLTSILENDFEEICQKEITDKFKMFPTNLLFNSSILRMLEPIISFDSKHITFLKSFIFDNFNKLISSRQGYFLLKKFVKVSVDPETQKSIIRRMMKLDINQYYQINGSLLAQCILMNFQLKEVDKEFNDFALSLESKEKYKNEKLINEKIASNSIKLNSKVKSNDSIYSQKDLSGNFNNLNNNNINNSKKSNNVSKGLYYFKEYFEVVLPKLHSDINSTEAVYISMKDEDKQNYKDLKNETYFNRKTIERNRKFYNQIYILDNDNEAFIKLVTFIVDELFCKVHNKYSMKLISSVIIFGGISFQRIFLQRLESIYDKSSNISDFLIIKFLIRNKKSIKIMESCVNKFTETNCYKFTKILGHALKLLDKGYKSDVDNLLNSSDYRGTNIKLIQLINFAVQKLDESDYYTNNNYHPSKKTPISSNIVDSSSENSHVIKTSEQSEKEGVFNKNINSNNNNKKYNNYKSVENNKTNNKKFYDNKDSKESDYYDSYKKQNIIVKTDSQENKNTKKLKKRNSENNQNKDIKHNHTSIPIRNPNLIQTQGNKLIGINQPNTVYSEFFHHNKYYNANNINNSNTGFGKNSQDNQMNLTHNPVFLSTINQNNLPFSNRPLLQTNLTNTSHSNANKLNPNLLSYSHFNSNNIHSQSQYVPNLSMQYPYLNQSVNNYKFTSPVIVSRTPFSDMGTGIELSNNGLNNYNFNSYSNSPNQVNINQLNPPQFNVLNPQYVVYPFQNNQLSQVGQINMSNNNYNQCETGRIVSSCENNSTPQEHISSGVKSAHTNKKKDKKKK